MRRLQEFKPREGMELATQQKEVEARENTNKEIATNPTEPNADTEDDKEVLEEDEEEITEPEEVGSEELTRMSPKRRGLDGMGRSGIEQLGT